MTLKSAQVTTVKLHRLAQGAIMPMRATAGAFGYDLAVSEPVVLDPGESKLLPTGLALAADLPPGIAMTIWPRSSTFLKYQLMVGNSIGLIDSDYSGELKVLAYNTNATVYTWGSSAVSAWDAGGKRRGQIKLEAGTKIAQLVFLKVTLPFVIEADPVARAERGGFGSTS